MKKFVRVDMNIFNLINEKYKGNISLQEPLNCGDNLPKELIAILGHSILFGQLLNLIAEGLDSGTESLGWLMLYLVCALCLTGKKDIKATEAE